MPGPEPSQQPPGSPSASGRPAHGPVPALHRRPGLRRTGSRAASGAAGGGAGGEEAGPREAAAAARGGAGGRERLEGRQEEQVQEAEEAHGRVTRARPRPQVSAALPTPSKRDTSPRANRVAAHTPPQAQTRRACPGWEGARQGLVPGHPPVPASARSAGRGGPGAKSDHARRVSACLGGVPAGKVKPGRAGPPAAPAGGQRCCSHRAAPGQEAATQPGSPWPCCQPPTLPAEARRSPGRGPDPGLGSQQSRVSGVCPGLSGGQLSGLTPGGCHGFL